MGVPRNGGADPAQNHRRDDTRVQTANAIHDDVAFVERGEDLGVGHGPDFVSIGVDVPDAIDACGQVLLVVLGEGGVVAAQHGQGTGQVGVFDAVEVEVLVARGVEGVVGDSGRPGRVRDGNLAGEGGPVA